MADDIALCNFTWTDRDGIQLLYRNRHQPWFARKIRRCGAGPAFRWGRQSNKSGRSSTVNDVVDPRGVQ